MVVIIPERTSSAPSSVGALLNRMQATGTMTPWPLLLRVFADYAVPHDQKEHLCHHQRVSLTRRTAVAGQGNV
jgi:hypothetical protein